MRTQVLSQIRILESGQVYAYEWPQVSGSALDVDLDNVRVIRHPFLVTPLKDDNFLLLEDTGYFRALSEAGLEHFPVHVCPAESLRLCSRKLGLVSFDHEDLARLSVRYSDQIRLDERFDNVRPPAGFITIEFDFREGKRVRAYLRDSSRAGCPAPLEQLFRAVVKKGRYLPLMDRPPDKRETLTKPAEFSAVLTLPQFSLDDLKTAATAERPFPSGIIEVGTHRRILGIDFPMSVLVSRISSTEKEAFMRELVLLRQQSRRITVYEGQVYLLNRQMLS